MLVIRVRNVNEALHKGLNLLKECGIRKDSRNGAVIRAPEPVTTTYENPKERILWLDLRDSNPIFSYLESMWMLAGRNDVGFPAHYAKQLAEYSDDGKTLNAAYGHRWRVHFGYDQLKVITDELRVNPDSRRCVLQIWDGGDGEGFETSELYKATHGCKDTACNTAVYFEVLEGKLNMTVTNRSNDVVWGAYGANAVHFSILQEYMATRIGVEVGRYEQVSNNYHVYVGRPDVDRLFDGKTVHVPESSYTDWYTDNEEAVTPTALFRDAEEFDLQLNDFFQMIDDGGLNTEAKCISALESGRFSEPAIQDIALPMVYAHLMFKTESIKAARLATSTYMNEAQDWKLACLDWFGRREAARAKKETIAA